MTRTTDLPPSILGVSRTVTVAQARKIVTSVAADYVRVGIAARFLVERGKGKSVSGLAQDLGLSKAQAGRVAIAADIVWQIGSSATEADAANALTLVNTLQANGLGKASAYLPEGASGKALGKALGDALPKAREAVKAKASESAEKPKGTSGARSGKVTSTGPRTDKGRADLAASTLAAIKGSIDADTAVAILAQAVRVAFDSRATVDQITSTLADALSADTVAEIGAKVDAA
jgi:hypothetical protein